MTRALLIVAAGACISAAACSDEQLQKVEARLVLDRDRIDFGERPVLDDLSINLHLQNSGRGPMELAIHIDGDPAFTIVGDVSRLEGGAEADLAVNFRATEMKSYSGKLIIETNENEGSPHELPLTGTGSTAAAAVFDPPSLDFGRVGEGKTVVRRLRITSTGTADLKVLSIGFKQDTSEAFGFVGSTRTPQTLAAHAEGRDDAFAEITVKFSPTADHAGTQGALVIETTDPTQPTKEVPLVAAVNLQPVAETGPDLLVPPGEVVTLDGSASTDPDNDLPLTFQWKLVNQPQGSAAQLAAAGTAKATFVPDLPGGYGVELVVTDAAGLASKPRRLLVTGVAADKLIVELVWDHPLADLDLHVLRPSDVLDSADDCSWEHPHPDWGVSLDPNDDPVHLGDKLSGFGPERVVYEAPPDGGYRIVVRYVSPQGSPSPLLNATIRIRMYGVIVSEATRPMAITGELWEAGTIVWPTGDLVPTTPSGGTP